MNKGLTKIAAGCLCALMLTGITGCGSKTGNEAEPVQILSEAYQDATVIGKVAGNELTRGQLTQRVDMLAASMSQQYGLELSREEYPDFFDSLKDAAFEDLVLGILLDQDAEKENFKVTDDQLTSYMQELKDYATEKDMSFEEYLTSLHASQDDMEAEFRRNEFISHKYEEFGKDVKVSDEEVKAYYDEHLDDYVTEGGIQISHILVETEEEANDLIQQLKDGADFAELAKEKSIDTGSGAQGGDLGTVNESTSFVPEFLSAALALEPGEMTETPVKSDFGYHIIKAGDRVEESVQPLETAKTMIAYNLKNSKTQDELYKYAEELRDAAEVEDLRTDEDKSAQKPADEEELDEEILEREVQQETAPAQP